jgi:hypothetical protein
MTPRALLLLAATLGAPGCLIVDSGPGPNPNPDPCLANPNLAGCQPPVVPGSGAAKPACGTLYSYIEVGAAAPDPGFAGYIITANAGTYRITWTGFKEFRGSIFSAPGAMTKFYPGCRDGSCSLASGEDQVVLNGGDASRVDFVSFPASGKRSGFDVEIRGGVVWLDLLVNGERNLQRISFVSEETGMLASAPAVPFGLGALLPGSGRPKPGNGTTTYPIQASTMPPKMLDNTFGVAWNGVMGAASGWVVDWQPALDDCPHEFRGSVYTSTGVFTNVLGGAGLQQGRDVVAFAAGSAQIDFASLGNMNRGQIPSFTFSAASQQIYFDLVFDGVEATRKVIFASGGQPSTNEFMPFGLGY